MVAKRALEVETVLLEDGFKRGKAAHERIPLRRTVESPCKRVDIAGGHWIMEY